MNKKRLRIPVIGLVCCMLLCTAAFAVSNRTITVSYGGISIYLNGEKQVAKDVNGKVVEPLIYEGTTYVPVRAVSEWLGKTVTWQGDTNSVYINDSAFSDTVDSTVQQNNSASVILDATWGAPGSMIDNYGVDWSKIDTSMCISGQDYHFYSQEGINSGISTSASSRYYFSSWVYGITENAKYALPGVDNLTFKDGENGLIQVQATDTTASGIKTVNISVYDITKSRISDWVTLDIGGSAQEFIVDPTHEYRFYVSNNHISGANVRIQVKVS